MTLKLSLKNPKLILLVSIGEFFIDVRSLPFKII